MAEPTVCPHCGNNTAIGYGFAAGMSYALQLVETYFVALDAPGARMTACYEATAVAEIIQIIQTELDASKQRAGA